MSAGKPPLPLQRPPGYRDPKYPPPHKAVNLPASLKPVKVQRRTSCLSKCRTFCFYFSIAVILLIGAFVAVALTFLILFEPRPPQILLKSIKFTKFNVTTTTNGGELDAASIVTVEFENPNLNLGFFFGKTHILLSAVNVYARLGEQTVAGFSQEKGNTTMLKLAPKVERGILDRECAEGLKRGFKSKNLVLNVEIRSEIGVIQRRWSTGAVEVEVLCLGMRLSEVEDGGSNPKCRIKLLNGVFVD